ncbi:MAG: hypothetical protein MK095_11005, partial [Phycisphaerales bacterium]|nr:hypothetical protein [Phycisphaerales bacterium]
MIHVAVMVCLAMSTLQRGAMDSLAEQVEELRATVRSSEASSDDRNDALQECLVLRSQVLNSGELDDTAQAILMCDQAEDLIGTGLALEQLGMTIMFGYPTEAESDRARARIKAGLAMVSKAELAVERAIFDLERIPASKRTATQRESLLRLREQERDRRLPLLRGAGLVHRAEGFEQNAARQATMQEAAFDLEALRERLNDAALVRATWLHGLALARLNRYDDAEAAFREAATSASASAADMLAARLGGVVNRSHQGGPDRGVRSADKLQARYVDAAQLRERLLIVDHLARLHAANGRYGEAAAAWGSLHGPLADAGLDAKTARALLDERIRRLPVSDPQQMKSAELLLAHAHREELDAGRLASALRVVLNSNALEQRQRARALSALALALVRSGESLQAVEPLLELARTMPEAPEAGPGIDLAARLSLQHSLAHPTDAAARALSAESLGLLLSSFSDRPGIDGWRLAAGRLAASDGRLADAMAAYESIRPGAKEEQEALRESAAILLRASRQAGAQRGTLFDEMRARRGRGDEAT